MTSSRFLKKYSVLIGVYLLLRLALPAQAQSEPKAVVPLPEVLVSGKKERQKGVYNPNELTLPKIPTPVLDTPQSSAVVSEELMKNQGTTTLRDALHNVSGISMAAGEGGNQGDSLTIRGFSARSDIFLDGMRDFGSYYRDPFNLEAVEVLKGPASLTFGRGSTGGIVNQATKTPGAEPVRAGTLAFGSDQTRRATADLNEPVEGLGEGGAFRINVMSSDAEVAGRDIAETHRWGMAPALKIGLGGQDSLTVKYLHQSANDIPDYGIPYLYSRPAPVDRENYYGFENGNYLKTSADVLTLKAENKLGGASVLRNQLRYGYYKRRAQITQARIPAGTAVGTPAENIIAERNQIVTYSSETALNYDIHALTKFNTGGVGHALIVGAEAIHETSSPTRWSYAGVPGTNLATPNTGQLFSGTGTVSSRSDVTLDTLAAYVNDAVTFSPKWQLVAGSRWEQADADYVKYEPSPDLALKRTDTILSWRGGLVFKPRESGSIYFSYGNSFNPSAEQLALAANTVDLEPEESRSYELGSKWDFAGGDVSLTGALFRTDKINARTPDPSNPLLNVLGGEYRVSGAEIGLSGRITPKWQLMVGYTFQEAKVMNSTRTAEIGATLANAPAHTFSVWSDHGITRRLQAGVGVRGVSARKGSTTPDTDTGLVKEVPGYVVADAMAKYNLSKAFDLQLNVYNIMDEYYFDAIHPSHLIPGAGRSFLLSTQFYF